MRKVPNANKPIKTNVFFMISWFARFKKRFGKLQKHMNKQCRKSDAKNIGKSLKKSSKIDAKTMKKPSKNRSGKRTDFGKLRPESPGVPWAPVRLPKINKTHTDILQKDNKRQTT